MTKHSHQITVKILNLAASMKFRFSNGILQNKDTANTMYIL